MVEVFDPVANRWEKCRPMTTARSRVGVAVVNGLLYAIGGYDGQLRLSTVEVYNPETDTWTRVGSMNSKRRYSGSHSRSPRSTPWASGGAVPDQQGRVVEQNTSSGWGRPAARPAPAGPPAGSEPPPADSKTSALSREELGETSRGWVGVVLLLKSRVWLMVHMWKVQRGRGAGLDGVGDSRGEGGLTLESKSKQW